MTWFGQNLPSGLREHIGLLQVQAGIADDQITQLVQDIDGLLCLNRRVILKKILSM